MARCSEGKWKGSPHTAALSYLRKVKSIFKDKPQKYTELLEALNALKDGRIDLTVLTSRVKELFKDHHELITGFNSFLPQGYVITLSPQEAAMPLGKAQKIDHEIGPAKSRFQQNVHTYNETSERFADQSAPSHASALSEALCYLKRVKATFQDKTEIYYELLGVLFKLNNHKITLAGLVAQWKDLLKDHPDLISGFNSFLPEGYKITPSLEKNSATLQPLGNKSLMKFPDEYQSAKKLVNKVSKEAQDLLEVKDSVRAKLPSETTLITPQLKKPRAHPVLKSPQSSTKRGKPK